MNKRVVIGIQNGCKQSEAVFQLLQQRLSQGGNKVELVRAPFNSPENRLLVEGPAEKRSILNRLRIRKKPSTDLFVKLVIANHPRFLVEHNNSKKAALALAEGVKSVAGKYQFPLLAGSNGKVVRKNTEAAPPEKCSLRVTMAHNLCPVNEDHRPKYMAEMLGKGIINALL